MSLERNQYTFITAIPEDIDVNRIIAEASPTQNLILVSTYNQKTDESIRMIMFRNRAFERVSKLFAQEYDLLSLFKLCEEHVDFYEILVPSEIPDELLYEHLHYMKTLIEDSNVYRTVVTLP